MECLINSSVVAECSPGDNAFDADISGIGVSNIGLKQPKHTVSCLTAVIQVIVSFLVIAIMTLLAGLIGYVMNLLNNLEYTEVDRKLREAL